MINNLKLDPKLDLIFEATTTVPIEKLWRGWTDPETLIKWFCPKPWKVTECQMKHEEMGFHEGWGMAFKQLVELMK